MVPKAGHREQKEGENAPGDADFGTSGAEGGGKCGRWCRFRASGTEGGMWEGEREEWKRVWAIAPGGAQSGTPGADRLGNAPGGADSGTPGAEGGGKCGRWCRFRDIGHGGREVGWVWVWDGMGVGIGAGMGAGMGAEGGGAEVRAEVRGGGEGRR